MPEDPNELVHKYLARKHGVNSADYTSSMGDDGTYSLSPKRKTFTLTPQYSGDTAPDFANMDPYETWADLLSKHNITADTYDHVYNAEPGNFTFTPRTLTGQRPGPTSLSDIRQIPTSFHNMPLGNLPSTSGSQSMVAGNPIPGIALGMARRGQSPFPRGGK